MEEPAEIESPLSATPSDVERKASSRKSVDVSTPEVERKPSNRKSIDSTSAATTPSEVERKPSSRKSIDSTTSSKPQTPIILPKPQLPKRNSERRISSGGIGADNEELKARLEKASHDEVDEEMETSSPVKRPSVSHSIRRDEEVEDKSPTSGMEEKEGAEAEAEAGADVEGVAKPEAEAEPEPEPEINPTLSRIHKIGRGLPSMLPEGGLSAVKLRSRHDDGGHSSIRQLERLDEDQIKKWIAETTKKDALEGDLFTILHDGQVLCDLINAIRSDKQITAKKGKMRAWHIVNINAYLSGCVDLRIKTLFKAEDLYEGEGLDKIIDNLSELKFYADSKK